MWGCFGGRAHAQDMYNCHETTTSCCRFRDKWAVSYHRLSIRALESDIRLCGGLTQYHGLHARTTMINVPEARVRLSPRARRPVKVSTLKMKGSAPPETPKFMPRTQASYIPTCFDR